jgi:hypothetical protein
MKTTRIHITINFLIRGHLVWRSTRTLNPVHACVRTQFIFWEILWCVSWSAFAVCSEYKGYFISPVGNWRKTYVSIIRGSKWVACNLWPWFFRQCLALEDIARSAVRESCIIYELCLRRKYKHVKLIGLYFKLFSDSREEMSWSLAATDQYQRFEICWDVLMANLQIKLQELSKNRLFRYGVPFLIFVLGGSFGLKEFTSLRWT